MKLLSSREMLKGLAKLGFSVVRQSGSHKILRKDGLPYVVTVPDHGKATLKPKTQKSILKQAGISEADILSALRD